MNSRMISVLVRPSMPAKASRASNSCSVTFSATLLGNRVIVVCVLYNKHVTDIERTRTQNGTDRNRQGRLIY